MREHTVRLLISEQERRAFDTARGHEPLSSWLRRAGLAQCAPEEQARHVSYRRALNGQVVAEVPLPRCSATGLIRSVCLCPECKG